MFNNIFGNNWIWVIIIIIILLCCNSQGEYNNCRG